MRALQLVILRFRQVTLILRLVIGVRGKLVKTTRGM